MAAFALLNAVSCSSQDRRKETVERIVPVEVLKVQNESYVTGEYYVGQIEEYTSSQLAFPVSGVVSSAGARVGDVVRKGQLLAEIDASAYRDAHAVAKSALDRAKDGYDRMKMLYDAGTLPEVKWVEISSQLNQARSAEQLAAKKLADTRMYAPFDGVVAERSCEVGEVVHPGYKGFRLVSMDTMYVRVSVPEDEMKDMSAGTARIDVPAIRRSFDAVSVSRGISAHMVSHTYTVRFVVSDSERDLIPGMLAKVYVTDMEPSLSVIPARSVMVSHDGRRYVWTVSDGKARRRFVEISRLLDEGVQVSSGLETGDLVITDGCHKVSEGMSVRITDVK